MHCRIKRYKWLLSRAYFKTIFGLHVSRVLDLMLGNGESPSARPIAVLGCLREVIIPVCWVLYVVPIPQRVAGGMTPGKIVNF